jgi:purine-nucleoside phosphorylase
VTTTDLARDAASEIARRTGVPHHDVAIVLGSGWAPAADRIGVPEAEVPVTDLPGFAPPTAAGHVGTVRSVRVDGRHVLVFLGRTHLYEGHGVDAVSHGVRVATAAGCGTVVLTNAAGGIRPGLTVGQPVLVSDHLNLTARSPLAGATFVDLTDLYSVRLRTLGADLVGMSTALEAIAARAAGAEVLGISLVTNLAAGVTGQPLDHIEVIAAGRAAAQRMGDLLADVAARV